MFKYIAFTKVETDLTVLRFRGRDEITKVNNFSVDFVSIEADNESDINALVLSQSIEIECKEITLDEFKAGVQDSLQIARINDIVKENIAKKYDTADEIAMNRKQSDDAEFILYLNYVQVCKDSGDSLKADVGYIKI